MRWSALAYRMDVENEIDFDARTFSYANIGRSRLGFEAEIRDRSPLACADCVVRAERVTAADGAACSSRMSRAIT